MPQQSIWRHDLEHRGTVSIPVAGKLLDVGWVDGGPKLWTLADPTMPQERRRIHMVSTGHWGPDGDWEFAGTVVGPAGEVLHVWVEVM